MDDSLGMSPRTFFRCRPSQVQSFKKMGGSQCEICENPRLKSPQQEWRTIKKDPGGDRPTLPDLMSKGDIPLFSFRYVRFMYFLNYGDP